VVIEFGLNAPSINSTIELPLAKVKVELYVLLVAVDADKNKTKLDICFELLYFCSRQGPFITL
jgi:hypothetical protein